MVMLDPPEPPVRGAVARLRLDLRSGHESRGPPAGEYTPVFGLRPLTSGWTDQPTRCSGPGTVRVRAGQAGSNGWTGLPEGSSTRIYLPPVQSTISLRNGRRAGLAG